MRGGAAASPAHGLRVPIRLRAVVLLLAFGLGPIAIASLLLLPGYGSAVRQSEEQAQLAVVGQLAKVAQSRLKQVEDDARALALVLAEASQLEDQRNAEKSIKAVLSSRELVDGFRFEVPTQSVSVPIVKKGVSDKGLPKSTQQLRDQASGDGVAFAIEESGVGALVVPVPRAGDGPAGFVVVPVFPKPLSNELARVVGARGFDEAITQAVLVDSDARAIASVPPGAFAIGSDVSYLSVWDIAPSADTALGASAESVIEGETVVTALETIPSYKLRVAIWRPRAIVLSEYESMRQRLLLVAMGTLVLAIGAAWIAAGGLTRPIRELVRDAALIGRRRWADRREREHRADEIGELSRAIDEMANDLRDGEHEIERAAQARADLSRYLPRELVDAVLEKSEQVQLEGARRQVTVLYADVVAFTEIAERRSPEEVVALLNQLFTVLSEVIFRHQGTVDKLMGDCIMGVFGAPLADANHAHNAVAAAEDMIRFVETAAEEWHETYGENVRIAIGVNSGEVIAGNLGSDKRMDYTVVGDAVNIAARLETLAAPSQILIGAETAALVTDDFDLRSLGSHVLAGKVEPTEVFELVQE